MQVDPYNSHKMVVGCTAGFMTHKHQHRPLSSFRHYESFLLICFFGLVLWRFWLGGRKGIRPFKKLSGGLLVWLSIWSRVQTCIWLSWCHCRSLSLAPVKSRLVLPFWYRLTWDYPLLDSVKALKATGDVNHKADGRLPLLSARPAVTPTTFKRAATSFAAWWTEAHWVWTVCLRQLPDSVATAMWTRALLRLSPEH